MRCKKYIDKKQERVSALQCTNNKVSATLDPYEMLSLNAFNTMIIILLVSLYGIQADTGSASSDGGPKVESSILQLQQLINQESMLRLTLDKQLQELRTAIYDLQSDVERIDERFQNEKLNNSFQTLKEETSDKFSKVYNDMLDLSKNVSLLQGLISGNKDRPVYFSAFLSSFYTSSTSGQYVVIRFDNVIVNEGGGYNPHTGKFTCPKSGAYLLSFGFNSQLAKEVYLHMFINGTLAVRAYTPGDTKYNSAERTSVHTLKEGDQVDVRVYARGSKIGGGYSSFSAVYIHSGTYIMLSYNYAFMS